MKGIPLTIVNAARDWLRTVNPQTEREKGLREHGFELCEEILDPYKRPTVEPHAPPVMPSLESLVGAERQELIKTAQSLSLSQQGTWHATAGERRDAAEFIGALALSYARTGDLVTVAALTRAAAHLRLRGAWLLDAERYLLEQQQPDGSFGLLAWQISALGENPTRYDIPLGVMVQVLEALAELALQHAADSSV